MLMGYIEPEKRYLILS